jgi:hypothetical protein
MGPSNIGPHTKEEPGAKYRALLGVSPVVSEAFLERTRSCSQFVCFTFSKLLTCVLFKYIYVQYLGTAV